MAKFCVGSVGGNTQQLVSSQDAVEAFQNFLEAIEVSDILGAFDRVCEALNIQPGRCHNFFPVLRNSLAKKLPYKYKDIWKILETKSRCKCYRGDETSLSVLVVGGGPAGLRTAIEAQLLGARTVVLEAEQSFTRNNVVKLWKFAIEDLNMIGVKTLYRILGLGMGNFYHISIRMLQTLLLKVRIYQTSPSTDMVRLYVNVQFQVKPLSTGTISSRNKIFFFSKILVWTPQVVCQVWSL